MKTVSIACFKHCTY